MAKSSDVPAPEQHDEAVIDQVAHDVAQAPEPEPSTKNPTTPSGQPVEEQVRKEWDTNKDGGLPTFLEDRS